jgi:hypothetical protein
MREYMRQRRLENPEAVRAIDRARYQRDKEKRRAAMDAYTRTPKGRAASNAAKRRWAKNNYEKRRAHQALNNALRDGHIVKGPCRLAGPDCAGKIQAHHFDYSRPLDVDWLCDHHHRLEHL